MSDKAKHTTPGIPDERKYMAISDPRRKEMSDTLRKSNPGPCPSGVCERGLYAAELSRFEQAKLPEENEFITRARKLGKGSEYDECFEYIDALRAHAAKVTVERDDANRRLAHLVVAKDGMSLYVEINRLKEELAASKAARTSENGRHECNIKMWQEDVRKANERAEENARDAERYRWLRLSNKGIQVTVGWNTTIGDELDTAVDAARAETVKS